MNKGCYRNIGKAQASVPWLLLKSFTTRNLNRNIENRYNAHVTDHTSLMISMIRWSKVW